MNIIVCIKRVPLTQEVDLEVDERGTDIRKDALAYVINDWDNYAIEEAVRLQEEFGGTVTAVCVGHEDDEEVLRRALALGADQAMRIDDPRVQGSDAYALARVFFSVFGPRAEFLNRPVSSQVRSTRLRPCFLTSAWACRSRTMFAVARMTRP